MDIDPLESPDGWLSTVFRRLFFGVRRFSAALPLAFFGRNEKKTKGKAAEYAALQKKAAEKRRTPKKDKAAEYAALQSARRFATVPFSQAVARMSRKNTEKFLHSLMERL